LAIESCVKIWAKSETKKFFFFTAVFVIALHLDDKSPAFTAVFVIALHLGDKSPGLRKNFLSPISTKLGRQVVPLHLGSQPKHELYWT